MVFVLFVGTPVLGLAQRTDSFVLAGERWSVPAAFLDTKFPDGGLVHEFGVRFELPSFTPVSNDDFKNSYPDDDKPILDVEISDSPEPVPDQLLLGQLIAMAGSKTIDNSLGGLEYLYRPVLNAKEPNPFNLYVNQTGSGTWFFVCYFKPNFVPLPCEIRGKLSSNIYVKYSFPNEYISQVLQVQARAQVLLEKFESSNSKWPAGSNASLPLSTSCWAP